MDNKERQKWDEHLARVRQSTEERRLANESKAEQLQRIKRAKRDFRYFVQYYFPHYAAAPSAPFHIELANKVLADPHEKHLVEWYRSAAKSVVVNVFIPTWLMIQDKMKFMVLVGASKDAAVRLLNDMKAELEGNVLLQHDFGLFKKFGDWADPEFETTTGIRFVALGLRQSPRGLRKAQHRPDYVSVDDIDDDTMIRNPSRVKLAIEWIERALLGVFGVIASRFVFANNCIGKDTIMSGMVKRHPDWNHTKVKAVTNGRSAWPEYQSMEHWERVEKDVGLAAWQTEYLLNPTKEGRQFKATMIEWRHRLPRTADFIVGYIDPSWKATTSSDHKAAKVWGRYGHDNKHLFRAFVRQTTMDEVARWCYDVHQEFKSGGAAITWYIEGNFTQADLLKEFFIEGKKRGWQLPILADTRSKPPKDSRIESMVPNYTRGWVSYENTQRNDKDMRTAVDHLLAWDIGTSTPDDSPDADEGAWHILDTKVSTTDGFGQIQLPNSKNRRV